VGVRETIDYDILSEERSRTSSGWETSAEVLATRLTAVLEQLRSNQTCRADSCLLHQQTDWKDARFREEETRLCGSRERFPHRLHQSS
jgi:hypothetical protein